MKMGISGAAVPHDPARIDDEWAIGWAGLGVRAIVTHFQLPRPGLDRAIARRVRSSLERSGIEIVQFAGVNANLVHPVQSVRASEIERLASYFEIALEYGATRVLTGCGSLSSSAFYGPHPDNHTTQTRDRLTEALRAVATRAEAAGVEVSLEPHCLTTLDTPENVRETLGRVGSDHVTVNFDPVNFISSLTQAYASTPFFRHCRDTLAAHLAPTVHIKDVAVRDGLVLHIDEAVPGDGLVDFTELFGLYRGSADEPVFVIEHLEADQIPGALAHVRACASAAGLDPS